MNLCGSCRNCCSSRVKVTADEIEQWKQAQRYDILLCLEKWPGGNIFLMHKNGKCIFLGKDCEIYPYRPAVCRNFPLSENHKRQFNCNLSIDTNAE